MTKQWKAGDRIQCDLQWTELKAADDAPAGYIKGIASTPSTDLFGHKVVKGAFDDSIATKGFTGPKGVKLLLSHDWEKPAGVIKQLETRGNKLHIEAQLKLSVGYVNDMYEIAKDIGGLNFSVGFSLVEFDFADEEDIETKDDPWLIIKKGDLMEVSVVVFPAQLDAEMTYIKQLDTIAEFERAILADGICNSRNQAHKLALWAKSNVHLLQPKVPLLVPPAPEPTHPLLDVNRLKPMADLIAKMRSALPA